MAKEFVVRAMCDAPSAPETYKMQLRGLNAAETHAPPLRIIREEIRPRTESELIRWPTSREPYIYEATAVEIV